MNAIWGEDYDFLLDSTCKCPVCPKCEEPIGIREDGKYHCFSCGKVVEIDEEMKEWFDDKK